MHLFVSWAGYLEFMKQWIFKKEKDVEEIFAIRIAFENKRNRDRVNAVVGRI